MESNCPMQTNLEFQVIKERVLFSKYGIAILDVRYQNEDVGFISVRNSIFEGVTFTTIFSIEHLGIGFEKVFYSIGEAINYISEAVFLQELAISSNSGEPNIPVNAVVLN